MVSVPLATAARGRPPKGGWQSTSLDDTAYLKNSGKLEVAQQIANHESPRTTKLYDRRLALRNRADCDLKTVDCYRQDTGLGDQPNSPFFLAARGETRGLIDRGIDRVVG